MLTFIPTCSETHTRTHTRRHVHSDSHMLGDIHMVGPFRAYTLVRSPAVVFTRARTHTHTRLHWPARAPTDTNALTRMLRCPLTRMLRCPHELLTDGLVSSGPQAAHTCSGPIKRMPLCSHTGEHMPLFRPPRAHTCASTQIHISPPRGSDPQSQLVHLPRVGTTLRRLCAHAYVRETLRGLTPQTRAHELRPTRLAQNSQKHK